MHRYPLEKIKETNASIHYLIDRIKKDGHEVDILTFKRFDRCGNASKFWKSLFWIFYSPFLVVCKKYDLLYLDDSYPFYPIFVKLASPRSKVILRIGDFHLMYYFSGAVYKFLHFFEKIGWRMADWIIPISKAMAYEIMKDSGCCRLTIIRDPVDPKDFPYRPTKNHGTVMFHGVLTRNKNVDILLEAARKMPGQMFIVVGDGPDRKRLEILAPQNVIFKGWLSHYRLNRMIATCAVGVALRSNNRGNEYVVTSPFLHYGVMGKPCLVSRRKVFEYWYPWIFKDVDSLVQGILWLLNHQEEGQKLRKYVLENHAAEKIAGEIMDVLMA